MISLLILWLNTGNTKLFYQCCLIALIDHAWLFWSTAMPCLILCYYKKAHSVVERAYQFLAVFYWVKPSVSGNKGMKELNNELGRVENICSKPLVYRLQIQALASGEGTNQRALYRKSLGSTNKCFAFVFYRQRYLFLLLLRSIF